MAIEVRELLGETTRERRHGIHATDIATRLVGPLDPAVELPVGTPMAFDTSSDDWVPFLHSDDTNGGKIVRGFVFPLPIQTHATNQVQGNIMLEGEINFGDMLTDDGTAVKGPTVSTPVELLAELQDPTVVPTLRELGIKVTGVDKLR